MWGKDHFVVFIAETWIDKARLGKVQRRIEFKNKFEVSWKNKARGLVMYWKEYFDLTIEIFLGITLIQRSIKIKRMNGDLLLSMVRPILKKDMNCGHIYVVLKIVGMHRGFMLVILMK